MEENKIRKIIIMSLAGLLIGSLLFIFGISIKNSIFPLIVNYICAMLLYISAFLAVYNNHKKQKQTIYIYIQCLAIGLMILISLATITHLL